jgi:hypothetical protein
VVKLVLRCIVPCLMLNRLHRLLGWLWAVIVLLGLSVGHLLVHRRAMFIGTLVVIVQAARPEIPTLISLGRWRLHTRTWIGRWTFCVFRRESGLVIGAGELDGLVGVVYGRAVAR